MVAPQKIYKNFSERVGSGVRSTGPGASLHSLGSLEVPIPTPHPSLSVWVRAEATLSVCRLFFMSRRDSCGGKSKVRGARVGAEALSISICHRVPGHHATSHVISDMTMEQPRSNIVRLHIDDLCRRREDGNSVDS